ncbi:unnamed protein product, partial [Tilletia controversa]
GRLKEEDEDGAWWSAWRRKTKKEAYEEEEDGEGVVGQRKRSRSLREVDQDKDEGPAWRRRRLSADEQSESTEVGDWETKEEARDVDRKMLEDVATAVQEVPVPAASPFEELRTLIKLDITV